MTAAVQPKARARYAAKRDAIMGAATKVFADQGMSGFTLAAVAKRMDLHPVSLTYYFKRKEDLAAAVLHDTIRRFGEMLEQAEARKTPPERLRTLVEAYFATRRRVVEGDEIPLASRIVAVVDAYCAMITRRSYKEAYTEEYAREEMRRCAGTQFDPQVVDAFLSVIDTPQAEDRDDDPWAECLLLPGLADRETLRRAS